ncbi:MAG: hypothetical protein JXC36_07610 [Candidatus Atribacteria bacterium]|nr:hypothetical protein [Candidatus Atribacteria bacterium]
MVKILYGYPNYEAHLEEVVGKLILGGCEMTGDDPLWGCVDYKINIYKKKSKR